MSAPAFKAGGVSEKQTLVALLTRREGGFLKTVEESKYRLHLRIS